MEEETLDSNKHMDQQKTPRANRLHIGIFGKVNSGKSSFLNAITKQSIAIVSNQEGTTTDPIYKAMEWQGVGAIVWIDTAGFMDKSSLGTKRIEKTQDALDKCDIVLLLCEDEHLDEELIWIKQMQIKKIPFLLILNKIDNLKDVEKIKKEIYVKTKYLPIGVSTKQNIGLDKVKEEIFSLLPEAYEKESIVAHVCKAKDVVLLVMPQDIQAPKGRLILPQVQTIRDLLNHQCIVVSTTLDTYLDSLQAMKQNPALIICDSQVFSEVFNNKPKNSKLTSFSILFAQYKGDIKVFMEGAKAIEHLNATSKVLIAEACTHVPLSEDIGRVKIPYLLKQRFGETLQIDIVSGNDFSVQLKQYDLIIHCGACMFNRKYVLSRIEKARQANVAITNYGVALAYLKGILDCTVVNDVIPKS